MVIWHHIRTEKTGRIMISHHIKPPKNEILLQNLIKAALLRKFWDHELILVSFYSFHRQKRLVDFRKQPDRIGMSSGAIFIVNNYKISTKLFMPRYQIGTVLCLLLHFLFAVCYLQAPHLRMCQEHTDGFISLPQSPERRYQK